MFSLALKFNIIKNKPITQIMFVTLILIISQFTIILKLKKQHKIGSTEQKFSMLHVSQREKTNNAPTSKEILGNLFIKKTNGSCS